MSDVTKRGVHNHDIDPACPETRLPDGSLRGACATDAAPPTVKPSVEALADALAAEGIDAEPGEPDLTPTAERLLALLPGRTEAEVYREGYDQGLRDAASVSRSEAEVKIEALRWAASVAVTDDEGIPWDDDHDRAAVSTWLLGLAARVAQGERGGP